MINLLNFQKKDEYTKSQNHFPNPQAFVKKRSDSHQNLKKVKPLGEPNGAGGSVLSIQNWHANLIIQYPPEPVKIVKPFTHKMERIASAQYNQQIIKKLVQHTSALNGGFEGAENSIMERRFSGQQQQQGSYSNRFSEPLNLEDQVYQQDLAKTQAQKFFNVNPKPNTAGQINKRKKLAPSFGNINGMLPDFNEENDAFCKDFKQVARQECEFRAKTAEFLNKRVKIRPKDGIAQQEQESNNQKNSNMEQYNWPEFQQQKDDDEEQLHQNDPDFYRDLGTAGNKVKFPDPERDNYETYRINKDVRKHMEKFLQRPISQQTVNSYARTHTPPSSSVFVKENNFFELGEGGEGSELNVAQLTEEQQQKLIQMQKGGHGFGRKDSAFTRSVLNSQLPQSECQSNYFSSGSRPDSRQQNFGGEGITMKRQGGGFIVRFNGSNNNRPQTREVVARTQKQALSEDMQSDNKQRPSTQQESMRKNRIPPSSQTAAGAINHHQMASTSSAGFLMMPVIQQSKQEQSFLNNSLNAKQQSQPLQSLQPQQMGNNIPDFSNFASQEQTPANQIGEQINEQLKNNAQHEYKKIKQVGSVKFDVSLKMKSGAQSAANLSNGNIKKNVSTKKSKGKSQLNQPGSPLSSPRKTQSPLHQKKQNTLIMMNPIEEEKEIQQLQGLDCEKNELSAQEREYIIQTRKFFVQQMLQKPTGGQLQQMDQELMNLMLDSVPPSNNQRDQHEQSDDSLQEFQKIKHTSKKRGAAINDSNRWKDEEDDENNESEFEIVQEAINDDENIIKKQFYDTPQNIREDLHQMNAELNQKWDKYLKLDEENQQKMQEDQNNNVEEYLQVNPNCITERELTFIIGEYSKPYQKRNYEILDKICQHLKFFNRYSKPTRISLLKLANLIMFKEQSIIFNQGDEGDLMYIIIKGGCHVRFKRVNLDGTVENPVVASIYDGQQFGDLALMNQQKPRGLTATLMKTNAQGQPATLKDIKKEIDQMKQENEEDEQQNKQSMEKGSNVAKMLQKANKDNSKRAATIETIEQTYLFTISRDYFKNILLSLMQQELDTKLKVLQTLPFFDFFSSVSLIPLAHQVETRKYALHEKILTEGMEPRYFYLISSGRVKVVKQLLIKRKVDTMGLEQKEQQKKLKFGKIDYSKPIIAQNRKNNQKDNDKNKSMDQHQDHVSEMMTENSTEDKRNNCADHLKLICADQDTIAYNYLYEFGTMERGDFFMGRSIISEYCKQDPKLAQELVINPKERAKLTVISDAAETELYIIDSNNIHLLPAFLIKEMVDGLISRKEYDHEYTKEVANHINKWDNFKMDLLKKEINIKKIKREQLRNN